MSWVCAGCHTENETTAGGCCVCGRKRKDAPETKYLGERGYANKLAGKRYAYVGTAFKLELLTLVAILVLFFMFSDIAPNIYLDMMTFRGQWIADVVKGCIARGDFTTRRVFGLVVGNISEAATAARLICLLPGADLAVRVGSILPHAQPTLRLARTMDLFTRVPDLLNEGLAWVKEFLNI